MGWWQRYLDWRLRNVSSLELRPDGFRIKVGKSSQEVAWSAISRVVAYKQDLLAVDRLCLLLELDCGMLEVHEEMSGYPAFEEALMQSLGLGMEWKLDVLFPAFATNPTTIFCRPS